MGYQEREYMRTESYGGGWFFLPGHPACRWILLITVVVFVLQIFWTRPASIEDIRSQWKQDFDSLVVVGENNNEAIRMEEELALLQIQGALPKVSVIESWCVLDTKKVLGGEIWRVLTCAFLHSRFGVWHIAINMLLLFWLGRDLEDMFGGKEFFAFYVAGAIASSLLFMVLQVYLETNITALGASGAVMAVFCLYTMYNPSQEIYFHFFIPVQMRFLLLLYIIYDLHPVLMQLSGMPYYTGTAHAGHLGGLVLGYLYYRWQWRLEPGIDAFLSLFLNRGNQKTVQPGPRRINRLREERLEISVDEILEKITRDGQDSLSEKEKVILNEASKHYQNRKSD